MRWRSAASRAKRVRPLAPFQLHPPCAFGSPIQEYNAGSLRLLQLDRSGAQLPPEEPPGAVEGGARPGQAGGSSQALLGVAELSNHSSAAAVQE